MSLTLAITETDSDRIGQDLLQALLAAYDEAFPNLQLLADVVLVDTEEVRQLNLEHRQLDEPTDVLSFPTFKDFETLRLQAKSQPALLGSIIICPEKAAVYEESLIQLVHHGLLHLLGYDHEADLTAWISEERRILEHITAHNLHIPPVPYETV